MMHREISALKSTQSAGSGDLESHTTRGTSFSENAYAVIFSDLAGKENAIDRISRRRKDWTE
jgi:hypothetical protein